MGKLAELVGLQSKGTSPSDSPANADNSDRSYIQIEVPLPEPITYERKNTDTEDCASCKAVGIVTFTGVGSYVLYETLKTYKKYEGIKRAGYLAFGVSAFALSIGLAIARFNGPVTLESLKKKQ